MRLFNIFKREDLQPLWDRVSELEDEVRGLRLDIALQDLRDLKLGIHYCRKEKRQTLQTGEFPIFYCLSCGDKYKLFKDKAIRRDWPPKIADVGIE